MSLALTDTRPGRTGRAASCEAVRKERDLQAGDEIVNGEAAGKQIRNLHCSGHEHGYMTRPPLCAGACGPACGACGAGLHGKQDTSWVTNTLWQGAAQGFPSVVVAA